MSRRQGATTTTTTSAAANSKRKAPMPNNLDRVVREIFYPEGEGTRPVYLLSLMNANDFEEYQNRIHAIQDKVGDNSRELLARIINMPVFTLGDTALDILVKWDDIGQTKATWLIENGAKVNCADKKGLQPLHKAAEYGNHQAVEFLLQHGADMNAVDQKGWTPTHYAMNSLKPDGFRGLSAYKAVIDLLLNAGADLTLKDKQGQTPELLLSAFALEKYPDLKNIFVQANKVIAKQTMGFDDVIQFHQSKLQQAIFGLDQKAYEAALLEIFRNRPDSAMSVKQVRVLVANAKIESASTALHLLAERGSELDKKSLKLFATFLISQEANVNALNAQGWTPLHCAVFNDRLVKINSDQHTHEGLIDLLLMRGADRKLKTPEGNTSTSGKTAAQLEPQGVSPRYFKNYLKLGAKELKDLILNGDIEAFQTQAAFDPNWHQLQIDYKGPYAGGDGHSCMIPPVCYAAAHSRLEFFQAMVDQIVKDSETTEIAVLSTVSSNDKSKQPIHYAAYNHQHVDVLNSILDKGVDVNIVADSQTPLFNACCRMGDRKPLDFVEALLQCEGVDVDYYSNVGTALHWAVVLYITGRGCDSVIKCLLENKADPNRVDPNGRTPLVYVIRSKLSSLHKQTLVSLLLQFGANPNAEVDGKRPLDYVYEEVKNGDQEITLSLLKAGANPHWCRNTVINKRAFNEFNKQDEIKLAILNENVQELESLFKNEQPRPPYKDPDYIQNNPPACNLNWLLHQHFFHDEKISPFKYALQHCKLIPARWIYTKLEAMGRQPKKQYNFNLHQALDYGDIAFARQLILEKQDDIHAVLEETTSYNTTPLLRLANNQFSKYEPQDKCSKPQKKARRQALQMEFFELLVQNGANVQAVDSENETALYHAARSSNVEMVSRLLELDVDVNACGRFGNTALHCAAANGNITIVTLLHEAGADLNIVNSAKKTAVQMANDKEVVDYLYREGADIPELTDGLVEGSKRKLVMDIHKLWCSLPENNEIRVVYNTLSKIKVGDNVQNYLKDGTFVDMLRNKTTEELRGMLSLLQEEVTKGIGDEIRCAVDQVNGLIEDYKKIVAESNALSDSRAKAAKNSKKGRDTLMVLHYSPELNLSKKLEIRHKLKIKEHIQKVRGLLTATEREKKYLNGLFTTKKTIPVTASISFDQVSDDKFTEERIKKVKDSIEEINQYSKVVKFYHAFEREPTVNYLHDAISNLNKSKEKSDKLGGNITNLSILGVGIFSKVSKGVRQDFKHHHNIIRSIKEILEPEGQLSDTFSAERLRELTITELIDCRILVQIAQEEFLKEIQHCEETERSAEEVRIAQEAAGKFNQFHSEIHEPLLLLNGKISHYIGLLDGNIYNDPERKAQQKFESLIHQGIREKIGFKSNSNNKLETLSFDPQKTVVFIDSCDTPEEAKNEILETIKSATSQAEARIERVTQHLQAGYAAKEVEDQKYEQAKQELEESVDRLNETITQYKAFLTQKKIKNNTYGIKERLEAFKESKGRIKSFNNKWYDTFEIDFKKFPFSSTSDGVTIYGRSSEYLLRIKNRVDELTEMIHDTRATVEKELEEAALQSQAKEEALANTKAELSTAIDLLFSKIDEFRSIPANTHLAGPIELVFQKNQISVGKNELIKKAKEQTRQRPYEKNINLINKLSQQEAKVYIARIESAIEKIQERLPSSEDQDLLQEQESTVNNTKTHADVKSNASTELFGGDSGDEQDNGAANLFTSAEMFPNDNTTSRSNEVDDVAQSIVEDDPASDSLFDDEHDHHQTAETDNGFFGVDEEDASSVLGMFRNPEKEEKSGFVLFGGSDSDNEANLWLAEYAQKNKKASTPQKSQPQTSALIFNDGSDAEYDNDSNNNKEQSDAQARNGVAHVVSEYSPDPALSSRGPVSSASMEVAQKETVPEEQPAAQTRNRVAAEKNGAPVHQNHSAPTAFPKVEKQNRAKKEKEPQETAQQREIPEPEVVDDNAAEETKETTPTFDLYEYLSQHFETSTVLKENGSLRRRFNLIIKNRTAAKGNDEQLATCQQKIEALNTDIQERYIKKIEKRNDPITELFQTADNLDIRREYKPDQKKLQKQLKRLKKAARKGRFVNLADYEKLVSQFDDLVKEIKVALDEPTETSKDKVTPDKLSSPIAKWAATYRNTVIDRSIQLLDRHLRIWKRHGGLSPKELAAMEKLRDNLDKSAIFLDQHIIAYDKLNRKSGIMPDRKLRAAVYISNRDIRQIVKNLNRKGKTEYRNDEDRNAFLETAANRHPKHIPRIELSELQPPRHSNGFKGLFNREPGRFKRWRKRVKRSIKLWFREKWYRPRSIYSPDKQFVSPKGLVKALNKLMRVGGSGDESVVEMRLESEDFVRGEGEGFNFKPKKAHRNKRRHQYSKKARSHVHEKKNVVSKQPQLPKVKSFTHNFIEENLAYILQKQLKPLIKGWNYHLLRKLNRSDSRVSKIESDFGAVQALVHNNRHYDADAVTKQYQDIKASIKTCFKYLEFEKTKAERYDAPFRLLIHTEGLLRDMRQDNQLLAFKAELQAIKAEFWGAVNQHDVNHEALSEAITVKSENLAARIKAYKKPLTDDQKRTQSIRQQHAANATMSRNRHSIYNNKSRAAHSGRDMIKGELDRTSWNHGSDNGKTQAKIDGCRDQLSDEGVYMIRNLH